jgi:hypothetical protein
MSHELRSNRVVLNVRQKFLDLLLVPAAVIVEALLPKTTRSAEMFVYSPRGESAETLHHVAETGLAHQHEQQMQMVWHHAESEQLYLILPPQKHQTLAEDRENLVRRKYRFTALDAFCYRIARADLREATCSQAVGVALRLVVLP